MDMQGTTFQPDELKLLQTALDSAAGSIAARYRTSDIMTKMAQRILAKAAAGERDPLKLKVAALIDLDFRAKRRSCKN